MILLLLLKAQRRGLKPFMGDLFEQTVTIHGYTTKDGVYVPTHTARVKRRADRGEAVSVASRHGDLFDTPTVRVPFIPTHELSDGTQVKSTDEPHVYVTAEGEEIEDRYAKPLASKNTQVKSGLGADAKHERGQTKPESDSQPKPAAPKQPAKPKPPKDTPELVSADDDLDPNSPNYRYRDTGLIAGARKMSVTDEFREAVRRGQLIRHATIDWEGVEANPRQAKELITKSNLFGKVDWDALKANGMDPGAGFLVDRVYASVGKEPPEDSPLARQDYARGIESLRERLETCKTYSDVQSTLDEMRAEYRGEMLSAQESDMYRLAYKEYQALKTKHQPVRDEQARLGKAVADITNEINSLDYEQYKYGRRRKGKRDPDIDARIAALKPQLDAAHAARDAFLAAHPELKMQARPQPNGGTRYTSDMEEAEDNAWKKAAAIKKQAVAVNLVKNPVTRAWLALGPKFHAVLTSNSDAFAGHRANVRAGKVTDWSWAEKEGTSGPKTTQRAARFQLQVADKIERIGGKPVSVQSTQALKQMFGLRDVQSGNWVLKDPESAQWHVQQAAGALMDLADLLGADPKTVAMNGRVALAFGARGTGNAGFGGAARAHYEPVERVVNITKMQGGGTLAHEMWHAIDNLVSEAYGQPAGADNYATQGNRDALPRPLQTAFAQLHEAMHAGDLRATRDLAITDADRRTAKYNLVTRNPRGIGAQIVAAGSLNAAIDVVDAAEIATVRRLAAVGRTMTRKEEKSYETWRTLAAAHYTPDGQTTVSIQHGPRLSSFALEAQRLDGGRSRTYWATPEEMAARAFQAWVEDRLQGQGRRNDYLSAKADNKYYRDPLFGDAKPFPEGPERERINAAFDTLVAAMRADNTLAKALRRRVRGPLLIFRKTA